MLAFALDFACSCFGLTLKDGIRSSAIGEAQSRVAAPLQLKNPGPTEETRWVLE